MAATHSSSNGRWILAVAYYRMSSDKQEASIPEQREAVIRYAEENGYRIVAEYLDEGISGDATDKRIDFQRMIADSAGRDFKAILSWDQDRFGRFDSLEAGFWIHPLRQAGVHLATVAQGKIDWNDFASRMLFGIQQEGKHQFLRDLSRNVMRGLVAKASRGEWPTGPVPYGYRTDGNGRLMFGDRSDVAVVRRVFREYLAGASLRSLARTCNVERLGGRTWTTSSLRDMLAREVYTGDFRWGDRQRGKYSTAEVVFIPKNHPAIIDRKTFDAVQRRRAERKTGCSTPHTGGGGYVLGGLLRCGKCGSRMYGSAFRGRHYYICGGYIHKSAAFCDRNGVKQEQILDEVITAIEGQYFNPQVVKRLRAELHKQVKKAASKVTTTSLRKRLASVQTKLTKAKQRLVEVDRDMLGVVQDHIRDLQAEQGEVEAALKAASVPQKRLVADADSKVDAAMKLFSGLRGALKRADADRLRAFLAEAVDEVVLTVRKRVVGKRNRYHLAGGEIRLQVSNLFGEVGISEQVIKFRVARAA